VFRWKSERRFTGGVRGARREGELAACGPLKYGSRGGGCKPLDVTALGRRNGRPLLWLSHPHTKAHSIGSDKERCCPLRWRKWSSPSVAARTLCAVASCRCCLSPLPWCLLSLLYSPSFSCAVWCPWELPGCKTALSVALLFVGYRGARARTSLPLRAVVLGGARGRDLSHPVEWHAVIRLVFVSVVLSFSL
jgi:hypothetical protein